MSEIHTEPAGQRFVFWADHSGGDPAERDKVRSVAYDIPGYARGSYQVHEDAKASGLRRFDREASDRGVHPAGTIFDVAAGTWRESDGTNRNIYLGGDYGDPITTAQAIEIIVELGYPPEVLTADPVREP